MRLQIRMARKSCARSHPQRVSVRGMLRVKGKARSDLEPQRKRENDANGMNSFCMELSKSMESIIAAALAAAAALTLLELQTISFSIESISHGHTHTTQYHHHRHHFKTRKCNCNSRKIMQFAAVTGLAGCGKAFFARCTNFMLLFFSLNPLSLSLFFWLVHVYNTHTHTNKCISIYI